MFCYLVEKFDVDGELIQSVIGPFVSEDESFRVMEREVKEEYSFFINKGKIASFITDHRANQITLYVDSEKNTTYKILPLERRD